MKSLLLVMVFFPLTLLSEGLAFPVEDTELTAREMLERSNVIYQDVVVVKLNACGEVDPYVVGDACEYTLRFADGSESFAWLISDEFEISPGHYDIRFLRGDRLSESLRWNVFSIERTLDGHLTNHNFLIF